MSHDPGEEGSIVRRKLKGDRPWIILDIMQLSMDMLMTIKYNAIAPSSH